MRKSLAQGWSLHLYVVPSARNRGLVSNGYALVKDHGIIRKPASEWDEPFGQVIQFADGERLCEWELDELEDKRVLHDFRDMTFEAIEAPYPGVSSWADAR